VVGQFAEARVELSMRRENTTRRREATAQPGPQPNIAVTREVPGAAGDCHPPTQRRRDAETAEVPLSSLRRPGRVLRSRWRALRASGVPSAPLRSACSAGLFSGSRDRSRALSRNETLVTKTRFQTSAPRRYAEEWSRRQDSGGHALRDPCAGRRDTLCASRPSASLRFVTCLRARASFRSG
jgi:hypothetical protein